MINPIKAGFQRDPLRFFEIIFLSLMLLSLPSLEAPKNIFLAAFIVTSIWRQFKTKLNWNLWDSIFLIYISSAFLSALFAGFGPGDEWIGFRGMLFWSIFGWTVGRANYSSKEITWIFWVAILSTLPPLAWGLIEYMAIHTKNSLQLHSVGHVNHSAIYLGIILGAALSVSLSVWPGKNLLKKLGLIALPVLFFIAIIIGQSRGVFGVTLIRSSLIILMIPNSKKIKVLAFTIFAIVLALMPAMQAGIIEKQQASQNNNNILSDRNRVWAAGIEAARIYPFLGIGNGNYHHITLDKIQASVESRGDVYNPDNYLTNSHGHNLYIMAFVERGILGLMALLIFMGGWLFVLIKNYSVLKKSDQGSYLWGASLSAWIITCGVGFVNSTFHHEHAILALLFLGLHLGFMKYHHKIKVR
jgi:O-antigen ligase